MSAVCVGVVKRCGDLPHDGDGGFQWQRLAVQPVGERAAGQVLHGDVGDASILTHGVDTHDAALPELDSLASLVQEALHHVGPVGVGAVEHLDCYDLIQIRVACLVDGGKAAAPDLFDDLVLAQCLHLCLLSALSDSLPRLPRTPKPPGG